MDEKTESELAALAQLDDRQAFHQLLERCQFMVFCLALRLVGSDEPAHDLLQEATRLRLSRTDV